MIPFSSQQALIFYETIKGMDVVVFIIFFDEIKRKKNRQIIIVAVRKRTKTKNKAKKRQTLEI